LASETIKERGHRFIPAFLCEDVLRREKVELLFKIQDSKQLLPAVIRKLRMRILTIEPDGFLQAVQISCAVRACFKMFLDRSAFG
jgi:hypothetical protein